MDIIFFAAIAFYIFLRLRKQLGKIDEEEKRQIEERIARRREEILARQNNQMKQVNPSIQKLPNVNNVEVSDQASEKIFNTLDETTKQNLTNILHACQISAEFFVAGAESAFEMIVKAFAIGDFDTLKFLLSEKIYQGFENAINQRKASGQTLTTNIISLEKAQIISAFQMEKTASVVVKFVSKQINYITDKDGNVIQGRKDEIGELTDIWTFKKDITAQDPNWTVFATSNN